MVYIIKESNSQEPAKDGVKRLEEDKSIKPEQSNTSSNSLPITLNVLKSEDILTFRIGLEVKVYPNGQIYHKTFNMDSEVKRINKDYMSKKQKEAIQQKQVKYDRLNKKIEIKKEVETKSIFDIEEVKQ